MKPYESIILTNVRVKKIFFLAFLSLQWEYRENYNNPVLFMKKLICKI